jgi:hypothetical protein
MKKLTLGVVSALIVVLGIANFPAMASPSQPTNVVVTSISPADTQPSAAAVRVSWRASTGAVSYSVSATANGQTTRSGSAASCQANNCNSTVIDLTGGVAYSFLVTAIASNGDENAANAATFTPTSVPGAPVANSATVSNGQAVLTWTAPTNTGGLGLTSFRITDENSVDLSIDPDATSYTVTGLTVGSTYRFLISAINSLGESQTDDFTAVTITSAPSAPSAPVATVSGSTITATWSAPADNGSPISAYTVYLVSSAGTDVGQPVTPNPATSTSASFTNVAAGTYTVQVVAVSGALQSTRSSTSNPVTVASGSLDNTPIFNPSTIPNMDIGSTQNVVVTAPSGGQVTVTVSANPSGACTFSAGVITAVATGTCTLSATVPANASYAEGTGSKTFNVKLSQTITFSTIDNQSSPGSLTVSAISSSGLSVRYVASGSCTISERTVSFTATGTCTITASQPGNGVFGAAQNVVRTFQVTGTSPGAGSGGGLVIGGVPGTAPAPGAPGSGAVGPGSTIPQQFKVRSDYMTFSETGRITKSVRLTRATSQTSIRVGQTVRASLAGIPRGTRVTTSVRTPDKKVFTLRAKTVGASRAFASSIMRPKLKGTYSITLRYGKTQRTLNVRVN